MPDPYAGLDDCDLFDDTSIDPIEQMWSLSNDIQESADRMEDRAAAAFDNGDVHLAAHLRRKANLMYEQAAALDKQYDE